MSASARVVTTHIAVLSFWPEALPAGSSLTRIGRSGPKPATVASARRCSSRSTTVSGLPGTVTKDQFVGFLPSRDATPDPTGCHM